MRVITDRSACAADECRIIGEEIVDETDRYQDNRSHKVAKRAGTAAVMREFFQAVLYVAHNQAVSSNVNE